MKRHYYTKQRKTFALQCLMQNYGKVSLTSAQLGIPKRTLQRWMEQDKSARENNLHGADALREENHDLWRTDAIAEGETNANETLPEGEYARIRHQVIQHINSLLSSLTADPDTAHLRVNALSRLLDRAVKLDALTAKEGSSVVRLEFQYPDGTIHDIPPWGNPDFEFTPPKQVSLYDAPEDDLPRWRPQRPQEDQAYLHENDDAPHWSAAHAPLQPDVAEVIPPPPESPEEPPRPLTREEYKEYLREQEKDFAWGRKSIIQYQES